MIAFIIVASIVVIGIWGLVHAIRNAPLLDDKNEMNPGHEVD